MFDLCCVDNDVTGKWTKVMFVLFSLMAVIGIGTGLWGFFAGHHEVFNNTREMPWGILISSYAFFAITSTGLCLLAAISHIFGGNNMAPLANRMVWLSIITIIGGFSLIGLELESPWRMPWYNITSPNITSNIWWMGTLYGMALGFLVVEFLLILNKKYAIAIGLGVAGALAETAANTNLGAVFSTLSGRPFWYGSQLPIYFLGNAFLCGAAASIMGTHYAYKLRGKEMDDVTKDGVFTAGKVMLLMLIVISVSTAWKMIAHFVGGTEGGRMAADVFISGSLSVNFWAGEIFIGLFLPILLLVLTKMKSVGIMSLSALLVIVGLFIRCYDIVVGGLIIPEFIGTLEYSGILEYSPSIAEGVIVLGGVGTVGALYFIGERMFGKAYLPETH